MFIGEFNHNIDDKGRMSIPSRFRDELNGKFYVTKGIDDCLFVFSLDEWKIFEEKLSKLPLSKPGARAFVRLFYAGAIECILDKQGRINITSILREHASIEKEVSIIGVGNRIEIWSKNNWERYNNPDNLSYDDLAEQMEDLGI